MIRGLQFKLVGENKAVASYNKTLAKSPAYHGVALSMARLSGPTRKIAPTSTSKVTLGFTEIGANSEKDCWYSR
jgi:hypothetical protein